VLVDIAFDALIQFKWNADGVLDVQLMERADNRFTKSRFSCNTKVKLAELTPTDLLQPLAQKL